MNRLINLVTKNRVFIFSTRNIAFLGEASLLTKKYVSKQFLRNRHKGLAGGTPGETVPFRLGSKWWATTAFIGYFSIPWWAPYIVVVIQMNKT